VSRNVPPPARLRRRLRRPILAAPKDAIAIRAVFVAPPRTIADITDILDKERPERAKLAKLKTDADQAPPQSVSATALAQFYYDRGNARALLARNRKRLLTA
jgi:hypothetical protein